MEKPTSCRTALCRMGAQDARGSTAKVERVAEHARSLRPIAHVQARRCRAHQDRKVSFSDLSKIPMSLTQPQRTRHHPPYRQTSPRSRNPVLPLRPAFPAQRPSRRPASPSPCRPLRRPRRRPPVAQLLYPAPPSVRRLRRARRILHGSALPGSRPPPAHNRALDRPALQLHLQEESGEFREDHDAQIGAGAGWTPGYSQGVVGVCGETSGSWCGYEGEYLGV